MRAGPQGCTQELAQGRAAIRIWQVFPFDLSYGWSTAVRALLVIAIAGSCIALVVQIVALARWLAGHTPHGGHMRTGR
jgi:hypothetical protein